MSQPPDFFDGAMPLTYVMIRILNAPPDSQITTLNTLAGSTGGLGE